MPAYHCPVCREQPHRRGSRSGADLLCPRCGCRLRRRSGPGGAWLMLGLTGVALLAAATPDVVDTLASQAARSTTLPAFLERFQPPPDPRLQPLRLVRQGLLSRLAEADRSWIPTSEPLPGGGTRYLYRRRPGEPELSIAEIQALMASPPSHEQERQAIQRLLQGLQEAGVQLSLRRPLKLGAAAEWDHGARLIRIDPSVPSKGTVDFLRVLTHESIHVAQSCGAGSLGARPRLLGLPSDLSVELETQISEPLYASSPGWERELEREAYANQHRPDIGPLLLRRHCRRRPAGGPLIGGWWPPASSRTPERVQTAPALPARAVPVQAVPAGVQP
ncbi:MAG: hypothetical protein VKK62_06830 [Synechococcaceae cyanobacterium]|nr:hypothetical protein [Synechococcaceae cyanobacterium]